MRNIVPFKCQWKPCIKFEMDLMYDKKYFVNKYIKRVNIKYILIIYINKLFVFNFYIKMYVYSIRTML